MMQSWALPVALASLQALLLIDAAELESKVTFLTKTLPALANQPKFTQAQLDSLQNELRPRSDFIFSAEGINQPPSAGVVNNIQSLIIGGSNAVHGQWPWQAFLYLDTSFFCGGSLIQQQWILTAAHCVVDFATFTVHVGTVYLSQVDPSRQVIRTIEKYPHLNYSRSTLANDIALLRVPTAFILNNNVNMVRLPLYEDSTNTFAGVAVITSGLGLTSDPGRTPSRMQFTTQLTVISNEDCAAYYGSYYITQSTLCTNATRNISICSGDSGGPLVYKPANGAWTIIGVTSFTSGNGCGSGPAGFARVTSFLGWLHKNIQFVNDLTTSAPTTTSTTTSTPPNNVGQWPWHALVYADVWMMCSGSLIKPQWVLTSAQCVANYNNFNVHLGTDYLRERIDASRQVIATNQKFVHPNYSRIFLTNNIALLKLPTAVVIGNRINIISLPYFMENHTFVGIQSITSFFNQNSTQPDRLQYLNMTIESNDRDDKCVEAYGGTQVKPSTICTNQMATQSYQPGGPLAHKLPNGTWIIIGIASSSMGNDFPQFPDLYSRVTAFIEWIDNTTKEVNNLTTSTPTTTSTTTRSTSTSTTTTTTPPTNVGQWPWHAFIYPDFGLMCSGSLIKPQWILTSAQCVANYNNFNVHLGTDYLRERIDASRQVFVTNQKFVHPNYNRIFLTNNTALLKLPTAVIIGNRINIISLPYSMKNHTFVGIQSIASGFKELSTQPDRLRYQNTTIESNDRDDKCVEAYGGTQVKPSTICTTQMDALSYYPGGPLAHKLPNGTWIIIGIASSSMGNGYPQYPDLYSRVTSFIEWIDKTIKEGAASGLTTTKSPTTTTRSASTTKSSTIVRKAAKILKKASVKVTG